jgi:hypothetical protein
MTKKVEKQKKKPETQPSTKSGANPKYIDSDGFLVLSGDLFWKWKFTDAEYQRLCLAVKDASQSFETEFQKFPMLVKLRERRDALNLEAKTAIEDRKKLHEEMGKELGVDVNHIAIDPVTGRIFIDQNGKSEPASAPKNPATRKKSAK